MTKTRKYNLHLINAARMKNSKDYWKNQGCNLFYDWHRTEVKSLVGSLHSHRCLGGSDNDEKGSYEADWFLKPQFEPCAKRSSENRGKVVQFIGLSQVTKRNTS